MKKLKRIFSLCLAACLLMMTGTTTVYAKSVITSVSLRVRAYAAGGDDLSQYTIDTSDNLASDETGCSVTTTSSVYSVDRAEWVGSSKIHVGDTPRIRVYLTSNDTDSRYFKGSYTSSNVNINGGSYVSAKKNSDDELVVTLKLDEIKGTFESPEEAYWADNTLGRARWEAPDNSSSGYYDIYLYRGNSNVHKVERYKGTSYNFYPYMTKKGTYTFKVRTVSSSSTGSSKSRSDWTESDEIYISEDDVSDGSGQTNNNTSNNGSPGNTDAVGWIQQNGQWYYRYPDGSYQKDSWAKVGDKWYLFNSSGVMLTGWQTKNGHTYFLNSDGGMQTSWLKSGDLWYYLNQNPDGPEGALCQNVWIQYSDKSYFVDSKGVMVEGWYQIADNWYYFHPGDGSKAVNTTIDGFYVDANGIWKR